MHVNVQREAPSENEVTLFESHAIEVAFEKKSNGTRSSIDAAGV